MSEHEQTQPSGDGGTDALISLYLSASVNNAPLNTRLREVLPADAFEVVLPQEFTPSVPHMTLEREIYQLCIDAMERTQLVYSDTGARGLNVRLLEPGQVFIASGPGIEVRQGAPLAVMAWLNSRLATCLLRAMTPKLTVAAGYIRRLPLPEAAAHDPLLVQLATEAVAAKRALLADRLGDDEHHLAHPTPDGLARACADRFARQVAHEWACLQAQARVETRVAELFGPVTRIPTTFVFGRDGRPAMHFIHEQGASKTHASLGELRAAVAAAL